MGKTRICGKQCHNAKHAKCRCWCGGTFHGEAGGPQRQTFAETFKLETLPTTEALFDVVTQPRLFDEMDGVPRKRWRAVVEAGRAAQHLAREASKRRRRRPKGE